MKKKLSTFAVFCLTFCILAVALSGCGGAAVDALIGNYYNDENNTEYISLDVVNTETDGIFSVHDVTIPNTSIVDVTEYNLKYVVESTNGNIKISL